jgi:hypothetical protein
LGTRSELEGRARTARRMRGQLESTPEAARDAAAQRQTETAPGCIPIDVPETRPVVIDEQVERASGTVGRHVDLSRAGGDRIR